jgi:hypothetical protein
MNIGKCTFPIGLLVAIGCLWLASLLEAQTAAVSRESVPEQQAIGHPGYGHVAQDRYRVLRMLTDERGKAAMGEPTIAWISCRGMKEDDRRPVF